MDESILKLITEYAANERLDDIMLGDEEHMAIQKEVDENQERLDGMNLSKEQKMAVDDLTASYIALGVCHAWLINRHSRTVRHCCGRLV